MLLGVKRRFAPFVEDGSKTHTIRGPGRYKVGMRLDCFVDPRQKSMRLLGRWPCVKVEPVRLKFIKHGISYILQITVDGEALDPREAERLAFADGFRSTGQTSIAQMSRFWIAEHNVKDELGSAWCGEIVHWDYSRPMEKS